MILVSYFLFSSVLFFPLLFSPFLILFFRSFSFLFLFQKVENLQRLSKTELRNPRTGEYDIKQWSKAFLSQPKEFNYDITKDNIEGVIPSDLCGTLFRNRPGLFERGALLHYIAYLLHYIDSIFNVALLPSFF